MKWNIFDGSYIRLWHDRWGSSSNVKYMSPLTFLVHDNIMLTELFCEGLSVEDAERVLSTPLLD